MPTSQNFEIPEKGLPLRIINMGFLENNPSKIKGSKKYPIALLTPQSCTR